jgi:hypothetical protein
MTESEAWEAIGDAYLGRPDLVDIGSQNPVCYSDLPEEQPFILTPCHCGCGETTDRDFLLGHDGPVLRARSASTAADRC